MTLGHRYSCIWMAAILHVVSLMASCKVRDGCLIYTPHTHSLISGRKESMSPGRPPSNIFLAFSLLCPPLVLTRSRRWRGDVGNTSITDGDCPRSMLTSKGSKF